METKICKTCKKDLSINNYRKYIQKYYLKKNGIKINYEYFRPDCKKCESEKSCKKSKVKKNWLTKKYKNKNKIYLEKRFFHTRAIKFKQYAKDRGNIIEYSITEITKKFASLWKEQKGLCVITGRKLNKSNAWIDHIIPITRNGNDNIYNNIRWLTKEVNKMKSNFLDSEFKEIIIEINNKFIQ